MATLYSLTYYFAVIFLCRVLHCHWCWR